MQRSFTAEGEHPPRVLEVRHLQLVAAIVEALGK
jgi:hypothetical protein